MQQMTAPTIGGLPGVEPSLRDRLIARLTRDLESLTDLRLRGPMLLAQ